MENVWRVCIAIFMLNAGAVFLLNVASVLSVSPPPTCLNDGQANTSQIGHTSGLLLILCQVFKNILLVLASIIIGGHLISGIQIFGSGVTSLGLIHYGIGLEAMRGYITISKETIQRDCLKILERWNKTSEQ